MHSKTMRYIFSTLILFIYSIALNAQSNKLDEKNGFNIFQLGATIKSVKEIAKLKKLKDDDTNSDTYLVNAIHNYQILGYPIEAIRLIFYKDRLLQISVFMPDFHPKEGSQSALISKDIVEKIQSEYGNWIKMDKTTEQEVNNVIYESRISGRKVSLFMQQYGLKFINDRPTVRGNQYTFISHEIYALKSNDGVEKSGL
jgi:hypothetical protein